MKNLKTGFVGAILIVCAVLLFLQHQAQEKLRAQNEALAQQLAQLQTDNQNLSDRLAAAGDSKSLSDEQLNELLKLRGEVGMLRQQTNELGKLRAAHIDPVQNFQPSEENVSAKEQEKQTAIAKMNDADSYTLGIIMYAHDNQGQIPTNFDQIASYLTNAPSVPTGTNSFELVYHGSLDGLTDPKSVILIQESQEMQTSNGRWIKTYGFADGHSEVQSQPDDSFDAFEQQHTISPPPNQ